MSLQQFFEHLYLHDSVVDRLEYLPQEQKLILSIDLCNYMQEGYQESEPEHISGKLTFTGVNDFTTDPDLTSIEWGAHQNGQILDLSVVNVSTKSAEKVETTIEVNNYITKIDTTYLITFFASDVEWTQKDRE
jgi:hypothetical protein